VILACEPKLDKLGRAGALICECEPGTSLECCLAQKEKCFPLQLTIPGEHMLSNALLAIAAGKALDVELEVLIAGIGGLEQLTQKMQAFELCFDDSEEAPMTIRLLDDSYNANPESTKAALLTLQSMADEGKHIAVLGDMLELGSFASSSHRDIILTAGELGVDALYTFGDCYYKAASDLIQLNESAETLFGTLPSIKAFKDKGELITALLEDLGIGSQSAEPESKNSRTIIVKGSRGMKMEEVRDALIDAQQRSLTC
jgi:UDP-N-acetylmuramoyl-tripeptide--D-alanyl-D-alanine ligase